MGKEYAWKPEGPGGPGTRVWWLFVDGEDVQTGIRINELGLVDVINSARQVVEPDLDSVPQAAQTARHLVDEMASL